MINAPPSNIKINGNSLFLKNDTSSSDGIGQNSIGILSAAGNFSSYHKSRNARNKELINFSLFLLQIDAWRFAHGYQYQLNSIIPPIKYWVTIASAG
jgi:hypothetical protein